MQEARIRKRRAEPDMLRRVQSLNLLSTGSGCEWLESPTTTGSSNAVIAGATRNTETMNEEHERSWFTTPRVILVAGISLGFAEITTITSIIFWPAQNPVIQIAWYSVIVLFFIETLLFSLVETSGEAETLNVVKRTSDPQLTWLYLHWRYVLIGLVNVMVVLFAFLSVASQAPLTRSLEAWLFFTGAAVFVANFSCFLVMRLMGQAYQGPRGASFLGASALASVAAHMLSAHNRAGMVYLRDSLVMLTALSQTWVFCATDLDRVLFTVRRLSELDQPPFGSLEALSKCLTRLPSLDDVPDTFSTFLEGQKWPKGFEPHHIKRSSLGPRYVLTFVGAILGIAVTLYPDELRNVVASLSQSFTSDPLILLAFLFSGMAIVSGLIMTTYRVGLSDIQSHGDRPLALAAMIVGVLWVSWLILVAIENVSVPSGFGLYPGVLLLIVLGTLVRRRLERRRKSQKRGRV